jgi:ribosome modulation factor
MTKINTARAVAMENLGHGKFEVRQRTVRFVGTDGRSALWGPFQTEAQAEMWLNNIRQSFAQ